MGLECPVCSLRFEASRPTGSPENGRVPTMVQPCLHQPLIGKSHRHSKEPAHQDRPHRMVLEGVKAVLGVGARVLNRR